MDTKIQGTGIYADVRQQVDPAHKAARVSIQPAEKGVFGAYRFALNSGVIAAGLAGASPIFAFRWTGTSVNAFIRWVRISAGTDTVAFAQGTSIVDLIRATGFTVQDTGGTSISIAGKTGAASTRFPASQIQIAASAVGNVAIANTGTLSAGTRTLDSIAMAVLVGSCGAVPANFPIPNGVAYLIDPCDVGREPLELQQNEGFVIRATVPATGTWKFGVEVGYDEVDPARYF